MATELSHYPYVVIPSSEMPDNRLFLVLVINYRLKRYYGLLPLATGTHGMPPALPHAAGTRVEYVMTSDSWLSAYELSQDLPSYSLKL